MSHKLPYSIPLWRRAFVFLLLVSALSFAPTAHPRADVRTLNPPVFKVELSGKEPITSPDAYQVGFIGGGGGPSEHDDIKPTWITRPPNPAPPNWGNMEACGFGTDTPVDATLTYPSGRMDEKVGDMEDNPPGCWYFQLPFKIGMELGEYHVSLVHPKGNLSYQWTVDYKKEPYLASIFVATGVPDSYLVSGLPANQSLDVFFLNARTAQMLAQRTITLDADGAVFLAITVSRSSGLEGVIMTVGKYNLTPTAGYAWNLIPVTTCPGTLPSHLVKGGAGKVTPGDPNTLRDAPSGKAVGKINGGSEFVVLDGPVCKNNLAWFKVNSIDTGTIGWTAEGDKKGYWLIPEI